MDGARRWAARLTLMLISFVWYGPSVYAAVEEINKPPVMNKIDSFYPLGAELEALRKDLLDAENAVNQRLQLSTDQLANMPIDDLNNKRFLKRKANIKKLDQKQRQQMEATLQHYKNHELSEKIIKRQLTENQNHMSSMDALHKALSAIDLNVDSIDQWQSQQLTIKDTLSLLQQPLSNIPQRYSNNFDFVTPPARDIYTTQAQIDGLIGADAGNYTSTDSATQVTQAITDKITELGTDPLTLYNWVHDTIRWLPSYGAHTHTRHTRAFMPCLNQTPPSPRRLLHVCKSRFSLTRLGGSPGGEGHAPPRQEQARRRGGRGGPPTSPPDLLLVL